MSEGYVPVPVSAARDVAIAFAKDVVVIIAFDYAHEQINTTTYGVKADDKIRAAELGPVLAAAAGAVVTEANYSEDFRQPALRAEKLDELLAAAEEVREGLNERISAAPADAKPVFPGIARLHTAIENLKAP